jgi:uncharacterized membrane protein
VRADALQLKRAQRMQWMIRALCLLGIFVAGYLAWSYVGESDPYCGGSGSCADVQNSSYAKVAGVPVPVIGLVGYMVLLGLSLLRGRVSEDLSGGVRHPGLVLLVCGVGGDYDGDMGADDGGSAQSVGGGVSSS